MRERDRERMREQARGQGRRRRLPIAAGALLLMGTWPSTLTPVPHASPASALASASAFASSPVLGDGSASAHALALTPAFARAPAPAPAPACAPASAPASPLAAPPDAPLPSLPHALRVDGDLDVYVIPSTTAPSHAPAIFLTGSCTNPLPSITAFQNAAASHGGLIALQGDLPCKGDPTLRRWSPDASLTSARIEAALHAAGVTATDDLTLLGYSQGAERAEWLARRFPAKYTRFVLLAGPVIPAATRLSAARGVVTLAGHGDVRENMAVGARRLRRAKVPALYLEIPGGTQHGELGPGADLAVDAAFDWLDQHALAVGAQSSG